MNKAYKIIWSHARSCYVVVAEIAKNHGKNNVKSVFSRLAAWSAAVAQLAGMAFGLTKEAGRRLPVAAVQPRTAAQWIVPLMTVGILLQAAPGFASTIKDADNKSLTSNGKVHDIYAQQILSNDRVNFGYNRFKEFKITQGDIANMYFHLQGHPENKTDNLVNLVKSKIDIQGTVNAIKDNRIGGNLYFLSADGMAVGKTGVINAGRFVAMVPASSNFTGNVGTSGMWGSTTQMAYQFEHYISNFGKRNDKGEFSTLRTEWAEQEELKGFRLATDGKIEIAGQVNTRNGMLLGAAHIDIKNGALLRGNKNIDFTSLVNAKDDGGTVVTNATLSGVGMTAVADDKSGDIILRAATEHDNTFLYSPTIETIINTSLDARVDVDGAIETDGRADISASATHKFDSSKFTLTKPAMEAGKDLLRDLLGLQIDAAGARKNTTAQVNLKENGKITAAGDVNLQADATTTIKLEAKIRPAKADGTTSAMPVAAATVGIVKNKALVDVKGDITSTAGDVALTANATTNASLKTVALEPYTAYVSPGDKGNAIYVGVSWLDGDNLAQINIDEGKNAITAKGGDFSAEAHATSDLSAGSYVEGADKTFASTSVTVLDFDTATNVNVKRSVEAESVKAAAENEIAGLSVAAEDANGEGEQPHIDFVLLNPTKGDQLAKYLKDKYHWNGFINGGKLAGLENAFDTAQGYITAGAAVAVVDSVNSAAVTVAPGVTLKATGDAVKKDAGGKEVPGGDVTLEANAHIDSLHHSLQGWANEQDADTASKVTVASSVLYSNIENDAKVELQGDTANHKGASLISEKGSVNLNATGQQIYDAAEPVKNVVDRAKKMWKILKNFGYQFPELANLESDTVKVEKLVDGKLKTETDRASFWDFCDSLKNFLKNEGKNVTKLSSEAKKMVQDLSDVVSPGSYTNYYVRSYMVDSQDSGSANLDVAASINIAKLHNKGIVSLGEKANISAGKNIKIDTLADTDVVTATGYGGEFFAMSESNGNAAGATVAVQDFIGDSLILSGKNVTLTANTAGKDSGNIALDAKNEMIQTGIILSAGKADKNLSATGSLSLLTGGVNTLVLLDDETTVKAAGTFTMGADSKTTVTNVVGGLALGSARTNATIGAGVAVNLLDVNSIAMIGDTGSSASTTATDTDTDGFKKKSIEEQNKIKAENALATARKVAAEEAQTKKMGADFSLTTEKLTSSLGAKTASGAAKGNVTAQNVSVTGNSNGTLNAVGIEGAEASESHAGFDFLTNWDKKGNYLRDQMTDAGKNVVGFPVDRFKKILNKDVQLKKTWDFSTYQPVQPANDNASEASFNATAAASVAWNKVDSETASAISGVDVNLRKQKDADKAGSLVNTATDDVFSGAWAGAAAVNWFNGATGAAANNNAKKGALGTALAVNHLNRNADAVILSSRISQAGNIKNTAIRNGSEVAAALGLAVTNDSHGTSTDASVAFGLAMNKANTGARALLVDTTSKYEEKADNIAYTGGTDLENSAYDGDIQVAGGVDLAWVKTDQAGTGIAAGMTAAVSEINNDIQSGIQGGSYTGLSNVLAAGEDALTQVNAAVGLGFTRSDKGIAAAGSLAYAELKNTNHSYISGTETLKASGGVTVTSQDISGKKGNQYKEYLKARKVDATGLGYLSSDTANKLGTGTAAGSTMVNVAVEISEGKTNAAGAALSINNVTNKFSSDITGNKNLEAGSVKAASDVHTNIVSVAAGVSVSEADWGGVGSLSFNDLDQDNIVSVTGNRNGTAANSGIAADTVSATAKNTSHIVNVTGDVAGGKNAIGLGIAYNRMDDTTGVYAANNQVRAKDAAKGVDISLDANNDAYALALSVGAAATYKDGGTVAAHGNFGINRGHNDTVAVIGEDKDGKKAGNRDKITNASSVTVKATDKTTKTTVAGAAELAIKDTTVALGVGVALTESDKGSEKGDGKETVRAEINNADITTVKKNGKAPIISAAVSDTSKATTVAVGAGLVKSAKFAAQGMGADANIYKTNTAGLKDTAIDKDGGSKAALVTVKADTSSTLKTGAAALQLSGPDSFLAGVVAVGVNRIKDTTTAGVTYTDKQNAAAMNVGNLDISSASQGDILSVAMGASVAAKGTVAAGGSGSHNYIENNATAEIKKANISSAGNVGVVARSDEAISNYAGVLDVAVGGQGLAAAIGVTGSNNKISGNTAALISESTVTAAGSDSNKIKTASKLKDNTDNDKYLIDSAVSRNTWSSGSFTEGEGDNKKYGVSRLQKGRVEEEKTGVVVDASATHSIASVMANGGVAAGISNGGVIGASVAGVINLNEIAGSTTAKVLDSKLNSASARSDVNVHAADYTNVAEFSGAASVGIGKDVGIAAGFTGAVNEVSRVTAAGISTSSAKWNDTKKYYESVDTSKEKNTVYAKNFNVTADAKQAMSAFNVAGAIAGSKEFTLETGDNVNINRMKSSTLATVTNATVDYTGDAKVEASHEDRIYDLNVDAGLAISASTYSGAGSLNVGVGLVKEHSAVTANVENSDIKANDKARGGTAKSALSVGASNSTKLESQLVSVGLAAGMFSGGVASSIAVNNIDSIVASRIAGSTLEADTIKVDTANAVKVKDATGTGGAALIAGVGVGVDVSTFNDSVSTVVDKSTLKAKDTLAVNTKTRREIDSTVAGVGVGIVGLAVNVAAVTVNGGINDLGYAKDADGKPTAFSHTDAVNKAMGIVNDNTNRDLSENFHGMTDAEKKQMQEKVKADADTKDKKYVDGTGVHTYVQNSSTLEAASGALTVNNSELNDAELNGGSGSLGGIEINVADTVYHLNQLNDISVKDSTVKGASVTLSARQGNVTENKEDAIHLRTVQAGLGAVGIGVGYAGLTTKGNTGIAVDHSTLAATNGDLTVKSSDAAQSKVNMIGVSAAGVAVPVSVAHNTNAANNFVTVKGDSTLQAETTKTQEVTGSDGKKTTEKVPAAITLQTERTGRVAAKTTGVGVGGGAVVVNTAKAYDESTSAVTVEAGGTTAKKTDTDKKTDTPANSFTADAIRIEAINAPVVKAEAGGTGIAAIGVAVMQSNAEAYSAAKVNVADGNKLLGDTVLAQAVIGKEGTDMTYADTHSVSGVVVSVAPNKAKAITKTTASVNVGAETYKTTEKEVQETDANGTAQTKKESAAATNLALITQNNASRRSIIGNTSIGIIASIGFGDAKAEGDDKSTVEAKGGSGDKAVKLQNLKIDAGGANTSKGFADGDSGGFLAIGAAATITMNTKTTNTASLAGAWDVTNSADIAASQQVTSKGSSKTGAGGAISVTWANSDNHVEMDTKTEIREGAQLNAGKSYVLAANKTVTGAYDGEAWNNHMNVGGLIQVAPDVKSEQEITDKANVVIGKNAKVTTVEGQVYDAWSDIDMYNKVEGKAGGAFEHEYVFSDNFVTSTNKVTVNEGASLEQKGAFDDGKDITLSSSDKIKIDGAAEVYIGGFEGTVGTKVRNRVTRNNGVEVNGKLDSSHDINLYAGTDVDGADAELNVKSLAEAHNNTLLSFDTATEASLDLKNNQQVKVGANGSATSVRNINLAADNGSETFKKDVVKVTNLFAGKNKEEKVVANTPGKSNISETNNNFVNVEGALKAGIHNKVNVTITGSAVPEAGGIKPVSGQSALAIDTTGSSENFNKDDIKTGDMDYATQLGTQLAAVEALIKEYSTGTDAKSMASYLGYVQQRQRILDELDKRGLFKMETNPQTGKQEKVYTTSGFTIRYVEIPEITVSGGNITVNSENLYGKGKLEANGAPQVTITNNSNAYLKLDGIQIREPGGEIRFRGNGTALTSIAKNADVNALNKDKKKQAAFTTLQNDTAGNKVSTITVTNENKAGASVQMKDASGKQGTYVPITDVAVAGDINNDTGDIRITNRSGSITIGGTSKGANITGRTVQLTAKDSISQDYVDGIVNIGGRPQDLNAAEVNKAMNNAKDSTLKDKTANKTDSETGLKQTASDITNAELGRIAGDSVYIAAADINVNGLIQSGYSKYEAVVGDNALNNIERIKTADRAVTVQGRTMYKVNDGGKPVYDSSIGGFKYVVQVYYDPQTDRLLVEDIDTKGGKVYLTGRISSTGNGRILAADGGADISVTNNSTYGLDVGKVLNNDIEGKITITDLAKDTWTEYTRSATKTIENYSKYAKDSAAAEKATKTASGIGYNSGATPSGSYKVKEGLRYNWTLGTETGTTKYYHKVQNSLFWGALDTSSSQSKLKELESSSEAKEVNKGGERSLGAGTFIDAINDAEYGKKLNSTEFGAVYENRVTSDTRTVTGKWKEGGDWYALWSNPKYHLEWTTKTGSSQSYTFSLKADRDIGIGFIGKEDGSISLANSNRKGTGINLTDTIKNNSANGALTIHTAAGSIVQQGDTALITGKADLQAREDIENIHITSLGTRTASGDGKTYTTSDKVQLSAVSTWGGNIDVTVRGGTAEGQALPGNVEIRKLESLAYGNDGTGDVALTADGDITQSGSKTAVMGREIDLTSVNGGIGTSKQALVLWSLPEAYGFGPGSANVDASAKKDIYLTEANADMRIGSIVSREGDVTLTAKNGRLLDSLPQAENSNNIDEDDLVMHWIDAGLIAGTEDYEGAYIKGLKQDAANYKARVEEQFALFTNKEASDAVKEMFTKKDGTAYTSVDAYLAQDTYYQAIVDRYTHPTFAWTKDQLLYSIRNAIVNKESGVTTETQGKIANVQGKNVTLNAQGIGMNSNKTTAILASDLTGGSEKAIANLKKLANADAADVTMKDKNGNTLFFSTDAQGKQTVTARDSIGNTVATDGAVYEFVIGNLSPLGVKAEGKVDVTASDESVFIAGRSDTKGVFSPLNTGVINAGVKDVRLYTQKGIYNALEGKDASQANIKANNLIAYGGTEDIGAEDKYLGVDLRGDLQSANADGSIYIKNMGPSRLFVGSLYAGDTLALDSRPGIEMSWDRNYSGAYLNAGKEVRLTADPNSDSGVLGSYTPLRILNSGAEITLVANEAKIRGVNGLLGDKATMYVGDVKTTRNAVLQSEGHLQLTGNLTAGSGAVLETLAGGDIYVSGDVNAENATIQVDPDKNGKKKNGYIVIDGNVTARNLAALHNNTEEGDITINGSVTGGSVEITGKDSGIVADGKLEATKQDISITSEAGDIDIGGDLDAKRDMTMKTSGDGSITLYRDEKINETMNIHAGRNISLETEDGEILVEGKITSDSGNISAVTENGDITLAGMLDNSGNNPGDVKAGGDITATVKESGDITFSGATKAGGDVKAATADGTVMYDGVVVAGNDVTAEVGTGQIWYDGNVSAGSNVIGTIGNGNIIYADSVSAGSNVEAKITEDGNIIYLGRVSAGRNVIADAVKGNIYYGSAVEAGRSVIARTGSGTVSYMGPVTAGKDLPEQVRKGYGKIAYYDRYGLVGYSNSLDVAPVRNAKPAEIKIGKTAK